MIIDTHTHYNDEAFDEDREELLKSLPDNNIEKVINIGADMKTTEETVLLAKKFPYIYAAVGVHPDSADEINEESLVRLEELCKDEKVVAIGEIGLDYYWDNVDREIQKDAFRKQIALARKVNLPIIIHSREAAKDTIDILFEEKVDEIGGVMHCYSYSKESAEIINRLGFYFGIGGVLTFKNGKKLREALEVMPLDRILLETDCPYLAPVPFRGKRNSSLLLPYVVEVLAECRGITTEEVERITKENAERLFWNS